MWDGRSQIIRNITQSLKLFALVLFFAPESELSRYPKESQALISRSRHYPDYTNIPLCLNILQSLEAFFSVQSCFSGALSPKAGAVRVLYLSSYYFSSMNWVFGPVVRLKAKKVAEKRNILNISLCIIVSTVYEMLQI